MSDDVDFQSKYTILIQASPSCGQSSWSWSWVLVADPCRCWVPMYGQYGMVWYGVVSYVLSIDIYGYTIAG